MKKVLIFALSLLLFIALSLTALAATVTVGDDADLLDSDAEMRVASALFDTHGLTFFLLTQRTSLRDDIPSDRQMEKRCGITEDMAAVVLLVSVVHGTYYYDMYTYNGAYDMFSDSDVDDVLDASAVYGNLKAGNIEAGAIAFFEECCRVSAENAARQAEKERRAPLVSVIVGIVVGVLAGGGSALGVFLYYRKKQHGESYPLDRYAKLNLTESSDRFVGSYVTRVRVQSSSGGGGGGGGSRGGHRGGR